MSQTFYSNEDINVVNSIGKFLATITKVRDSFKNLMSDCNETLRIIDFNKNLYDLVNRFKKKNKLNDYLKSLAIDDHKLDKEGIELVNEIMEGSASVFIKSNEKELNSVFKVGKNVDWEKIIPELQLSKLSKLRVTIVRDLFSYELKMKSALIIFLKQGNEELFLVVFRETSEFELADEELGEKLADTILHYDLSFNSEAQNTKSDDIRQFEINDSDSYNLLSLLQEFKLKLNILLDTNSSSVYIVNQKSKSIWTKSSNSSKPLVYQISPDSILGYSYLNKQIVLLPDYSHKFSDIKSYQDKYIVCLPVCESTFTHPVIALVLVTRSTQFSNSEIIALNKFSETLANILYMNYLEIVKKWKVKHSSSLNTSSRTRINEDLLKRKRASIMNVSLAHQSTESILEAALRCQEVKFYDKNEFSDLEDVDSAIKKSRETGKYVYIDMNKDSSSDSLLVLPVGSQRLVFRNFSYSLNNNQIDSIYALINKIHSPKSMIEKTLEKTKQEGTISRWISHLILVESTAISKLIICKSFVENLDSKLDISRLGHMAVKLLKILTNASNVYIVVKDEHELVMFKDDRLYIDLNNDVNDLYDQSSAVKSILRLPLEGVQDNWIVVPIIHNEHIGMISLSGKLDDINRDLCSFTSKDEKIVQELAKAFSQAANEYPSPQDSTLINFSQHLCTLAVRYSPKDVTNTVIKASSLIFDCEKVNFYYFSDGQLRLFSQNSEEMSNQGVVFQIQGVFEAAVNSKVPKFLNSMNDQETLYQEIEKLTGYKTNSMLIIPLKNINGEVFGLIECVNKISHYFDDKDLQSAKEVAKVYERVLENWEVTKKNIKEMYRLKSISSSLALVVLVFSKKGRLTYTNQSIEKIFGISEQEIRESHYSEWLSTNKDLKEDIESVFTNPSVSIRRTSQQIRPGKSKRYLQPFASFNKSKTLFNYRVVPLRTVSSGVILILEDCSALEALHKGFRDVQNQIRAITLPVAAETGLQKCIRELDCISEQVLSSDIKDQINEVLETLRAGSLKKPKFVLEDADMEEFETVNSIFYVESTEFLDIPDDFEQSRSSLPDQSLLVPLSELRDWNLNAFKIENKFGYIVTMLTDFNAIDQFHINTGVLFAFMKKIQIECDKRQNPFHNFTHCFSVMHSAYMLISSTIALNFFSGINIFAILIAAVCHDVDHTGRTNMFEINSKSALAIFYNDKSVLEQHHAAVAFSILNEPESNFLNRVPRETMREIRKIMITAIMGTDMSKHYSILTNINSRTKDTSNDIGSLPKDTEKLAQFILHAADLAHPTKDYGVYEMWSMLVCQEFSDQSQEEYDKNLPMTEFMKDLQNPKVYYANEIGFLNFVVRPLWDCAHNLLKSNIELLVENLEKNIETMKLKLEEWKRVES